jgi:hypothetical protein
VHGHILGADAKQQRWLASHGGRPAAYFVPRSSLLPIERLNAELLDQPHGEYTPARLHAS